MLAAEEKEAKKREQQAAKQAKEEAKKAEAAAKVARAKANNLKSGDKHATVAELTVHLSGTAFRSEDSGGDTDSDEDSDAMYETPAERKRRKKAKQKKASSWVEIGGLLRERMSEHGCQVETPEVPRQDVGCEGAMRWTRWCDKKWNDERREFEPLGAGSEIVVEEDSRLVFMCVVSRFPPMLTTVADVDSISSRTALELSKHVANRTLERHISSVLAAIPSHVHLFLMHYGLKTLCREITNSEQAAYREQARANLNGGSAADAPAPKPKAVGIGPKQPGKEALEYELMK